MNLSGLFGKIMGFLVIIITLALAPQINTANTAITGSGNLTGLLGMSTVGSFGAPIIILGLLVSGGIFALAGIKGQLGGASARDLFEVVGSVIVIIVMLTLFIDVIDYTHALYVAATGFAQTIYSIIPLIIYIGILAAAGWAQVSTYRRTRKGKKGKKGQSAATANY